MTVPALAESLFFGTGDPAKLFLLVEIIIEEIG
jgi:hypothetical protein